MIYGILSDIHGNLEALEAVLADFYDNFGGALVCLGDIVGYGANPEECMARLTEHCDFIPGVGVPIVKGNHDEAVHSGIVDRFTERAAEAAIWANHRLGEERKEFLASLPYTLELRSSYLVHGSPLDPERFHYIVTNQDIAKAFESFPEESGVCFFGHTHVPLAWRSDEDGLRPVGKQELVLEPDHRYLINPGSVGQPRDRDPRAAYLVWDIEKKSVLFRRVEYDVETARRKILQAGLPESLAWRLESGT